jgi:hypothetical protein
MNGRADGRGSVVGECVVACHHGATRAVSRTWGQQTRKKRPPHPARRAHSHSPFALAGATTHAVDKGLLDAIGCRRHRAPWRPHIAKRRVVVVGARPRARRRCKAFDGQVRAQGRRGLRVCFWRVNGFSGLEEAVARCERGRPAAARHGSARAARGPVGTAAVEKVLFPWCGRGVSHGWVRLLAAPGTLPPPP